MFNVNIQTSKNVPNKSETARKSAMNYIWLHSRFARLSADPFCLRSHCDHLRDWRSFSFRLQSICVALMETTIIANDYFHSEWLRRIVVSKACSSSQLLSFSLDIIRCVVIVITFHLFYNDFLHSHFFLCLFLILAFAQSTFPQRMSIFSRRFYLFTFWARFVQAYSTIRFRAIHKQLVVCRYCIRNGILCFAVYFQWNKQFMCEMSVQHTHILVSFVKK